MYTRMQSTFVLYFSCMWADLSTILYSIAESAVVSWAQVDSESIYIYVALVTAAVVVIYCKCYHQWR